MTALCLICEKHLGRGPLVGTAVWSNDTVVVSHQGVGDDGTAALGQLYVDSRRHVATFDELTLPSGRSRKPCRRCVVQSGTVSVEVDEMEAGDGWPGRLQRGGRPVDAGPVPAGLGVASGLGEQRRHGRRVGVGVGQGPCRPRRQLAPSTLVRRRDVGGLGMDLSAVPRVQK